MWKYFWLPHRKKHLQASLVSSSFRASTSEKSEAFVARERTIKASFVGPLLIVLPIGGERASVVINVNVVINVETGVEKLKSRFGGTDI